MADRVAAARLERLAAAGVCAALLAGTALLACAPAGPAPSTAPTPVSADRVAFCASLRTLELDVDGFDDVHDPASARAPLAKAEADWQRVKDAEAGLPDNPVGDIDLPWRDFEEAAHQLQLSAPATWHNLLFPVARLLRYPLAYADRDHCPQPAQS